MTSALAPAMVVALIVALFAGFPVAFSLAAVAVLFGVLGVMVGNFNAVFLEAMFFRLQGVFSNDNLLAVPMLIFMGMLMERTGIADDMFRSINRLFGSRPGGLAYATIIVGAVLSAITGFVSASVIAIGLMALPAMLRSGYNSRLATGVVAAAGTLAQVIPPSLVLIVLAEQLEISLRDIYRGAMLPSLLLVIAYLSYVYLVSRRNPQLAPGSAREGEIRWPELWFDAAIAAGIPLGIVLAVLASVYFGIATPTEGGAIGVTGTLLFGLFRRRLTGRNLRQAMDVTGILLSGIMFLLLGASFFTLVFRGLDGHTWIESWFLNSAFGAVEFVIFLNVVIFFLAFFLEFFEIAFIVLPLIVPVAHQLGVDMVWLGVMLAVNLQTSFMHPPFGIAIYNLRSVAPRSVRTADLYWGAVPFLLMQLAMVVILIFVPQIVLRSPEENPVMDIIEIEAPPTYTSEEEQE